MVMEDGQFKEDYPSAFGHKRGASRVTEIVKVCPDLNMRTLHYMLFQLKIGNVLLMK